MLANESLHMARSSRQVAANSIKAPSLVERRAMMVLFGGSLASAFVLPRPSYGYGGQKQLSAMDAGSGGSGGNKDYEELMKAIKARRAAAEAPAKPEPKPQSK